MDLKRIRVLLIVTGMPDVNGSGGSQFNMVYLQALKKIGINTTVIHLRSINPRRKLFEKKIVDGVDRITISCYSPPIKKLFRSKFLSWLFKIIIRDKDIQFNMIHGVGGGTAIASYLMANLSNTPYILQFIGSDVNVHLDYYLKIKNFQFAVNNASFIGFNSRKLMIDFKKKHKGETNSETIYRGIDLEKFTFTNFETNELRILFLGGVKNHNSKGAFTMVELCNKLINKTTVKDQVIINLGGPNINKIKPYLQVGKFNSTEVNIIGAISSEEVLKYMKDSNVLIVPSLAEGLPNVIYEAMATGNVVIATNVGGIPEILTHRETGFLIDKQCPDLIIKILEELANDPFLKNRIIVEARRTVENFSYSSFVKKYTDLYVTFL